MRAAVCILCAFLWAMTACGDSADTPDAAPCAAVLSDGDRAARLAWVAGRVADEVARFETTWSDGAGGIACPPADGSRPATIHDFGDYALAKLVLSPGNDPAATALAAGAVRCMMSFETPAGLFPFHAGDPAALDDNGTEFALLPLATLVRRFGFPLPAGFQAGLRTGMAAIEGHAVCPAYTNICLMQAADLMALHGWLGESVASGQRRLESWLAFTRAGGVSEYDSPTYNEVDLEVLLVAMSAAPDATVRGEAQAALDYLFADLAASTFTPAGTLAGPMSRSYNFLTGDGGISTSLYLEGLRSAAPQQLPDLTKAVLLVDGGRSYRAPAASLCVAATREVRSTWSADAQTSGRQRYLWVTPDVTLGTTSADYGTSLSSDQELPVRAQLAGAGSAIDVIPDYLDAPGTMVQAGDFTKVTHLLMSPAAAQKQGAALVLLDVPAKDPRYTGTNGLPVALVNLGTHVLLPADASAEIAVDGTPVAASADTLVTAAHPVVTVRVGTAVLGVAVVDASGLDCAPATGGITETGAAEIHVKPLVGSASWHGPVARLSVYHDLHPPADTSTLAPCFARAALLLVARRCDAPTCGADLATELHAASITSTFTAATGDWDVRAVLSGGPDLHVHRIVGNGAHVLAREVDGAAMTFTPLEVNGAPVVLGP